MALSRRSMGPRGPEFIAMVADDVERINQGQSAARATIVERTDRSITIKLETIMHTLDELLTAVTAQRTKIDSLVALLISLHTQVKAAVGETLTPSQQDRIDRVFAQVNDNADVITAALAENTVEASAGAISDGPSAADIKASLSGTNTGIALGDAPSGSAGVGSEPMTDASGGQSSTEGKPAAGGAPSPDGTTQPPANQL